MPRMREPVEVVSGVWWLRGLRGCNVYAVRLDGGAVALIDSGALGSAAAAERSLRAAGIHPREVSILLLTHRHWDHAASAATLRTRLRLEVAAGAGDVRDGHLRGELRRRFGRHWPAERVAVDLPLPADRESEPLPGLLAIPAPGHTDGSVCYLLPDRGFMFIGDVALRSRDHMSRPLPLANDDTASQEESLRAIAARAPDHGGAGHGAPLTDHFGQWMRDLAARDPRSGSSLLRALKRPVQMAHFTRRMLFGS